MENKYRGKPMHKRSAGLQFDKENKTYSIDKQINGTRIRRRLQASTLAEAEIEFHFVISNFYINENNNQEIMTFPEAGIKYINESKKKSIDRDIATLKAAHPFLMQLTLKQVHNDSLLPFINARKEAGIKSATVNRDLAVIHRILKLAAEKWRTKDGNPYLPSAPLFEKLDWNDQAKPFPLNKKQQLKLFHRLPKHLRNMAFFTVNTGLREQSVCWLRWEWEVKIPELNTSIFIIPAKSHKYADGTWIGEKNKEDQIVVLNLVAKSVIDIQRRKRTNDCPYVFPYKDKRIGSMNNSAWQNAWVKAGLPKCKEISRGPHNLKHTYGRRLRVAKVSLETRKTLLHHKNGDITTHYSPAEVAELLTASEKVVQSISTTLLN